MLIDEDLAWIIMGALSICYSEGINGVPNDRWGPPLEEKEEKLIAHIKSTFPNVAAHYSWLW